MAEVEYGGSGSTRESVMDYFDVFLPSSLLDQFEDRVENSWAPVNGLTPWKSLEGRDSLNKAILGMAVGLFENFNSPRYVDECGFKRFKFSRLYKTYDSDQAISDGLPINIAEQGHFANELTNRLFRHKFMSPLVKAANPQELEYYNSEANRGVYSTILSLLIRKFALYTNNHNAGNGTLIDTERKNNKVLDGGTANRTVMIPIMITKNLNFGENAPHGIQIDVNAYNTVELDQEFTYDVGTEKAFNNVTFRCYKKRITGVSVGGAHKYNDSGNVIDAIRYCIGEKSFAVASTLHCDEGNKWEPLEVVQSAENNGNGLFLGDRNAGVPQVKRPTEFFVYVDKIYQEGNNYFVNIFIPYKATRYWNEQTKTYEQKDMRHIKISNISKASAMITLSVWNYINPFAGIAEDKAINPKTPIFQGIEPATLPQLFSRNHKVLYSLFANSISSMSTQSVTQPLVVGYTNEGDCATFCGASAKKENFAKGAFMVIIIGIQYNPYLEDDFIGDRSKESFMSYIDNYTPASSRYNGSLSQIVDMFGVSINFRPIGGKTDVFEA